MNLPNQESSSRSFRAEREFGWIVGGMLMLIGGWWLYRGHWKLAAEVFVGLGAVLVVLGSLVPRALVSLNRAWMELARLLSLVTTPIILGLVYFGLFMPIGVIKRRLGWDPLRRRAPSAGSYWIPYNPRQQNPQHFDRMY
jgi:hypothetical protein